MRRLRAEEELQEGDLIVRTLANGDEWRWIVVGWTLSHTRRRGKLRYRRLPHGGEQTAYWRTASSVTRRRHHGLRYEVFRPNPGEVPAPEPLLWDGDYT